LFAREDFLNASRKFVCIRIETYENKEAEKKVRSLLNGRYANTAFCIFDPQGERKLTGSGRGPSTALASRGGKGRGVDDGSVVRQMHQIASRYSPTGGDGSVVLQDFYSFRQALNVASADQRLLVCANVSEQDRKQVEENLKVVFADSEIEGKFHLNFLDPKVDRSWSKSIKGKTNVPGIMIIRSGTFGLDGVVMKQLSSSASGTEIKDAMIQENERFSSQEVRKQYSLHVRSGKRQGVHFENEISREGTSDQPRQNGKRRSRSRR